MNVDKKQSLQKLKLEPDSELRFQVNNTEDVKAYLNLTLKTGSAEIFGTQLAKGKTYEFTKGARIAVFTWQGCMLEVEGETNFIEIVKETPTMIYANCHAVLEVMRTESEKNNKKGPTVIVAGPTDVGKSTLCKILLNYAVRMGHRPIYIDLDIGQGSISIPGTVGALVIERPASVNDGFSQDAPLVYNFGHNSPSGNAKLYEMIIDQVALTLKEKLEVNRKTKHSGVIINTCGWTKGGGYKHLLHSCKAFEVDVILVLDEERLYNELIHDMPNFVKVVFLPKSSGVLEISKRARTAARDQRIHEYFYGTEKNQLQPHSIDLEWSQVKIFKIGILSSKDKPHLLHGDNTKDYFTNLVPLTPSPCILHHLLAVSFAEKEDDVILSHVAGFVCVLNVDTEKQIVTLLSPQPKPLPNNILVFSELQFMGK